MSLIALDGDGVLLDYNLGYGVQLHTFFGGDLPRVVDPSAYHATNYWGVEQFDVDHPFWAHFDRNGWRTMPAMEGAVDACVALAMAGHELVCVSSMPSHRADDRLANLQALGFPIERVIGTGPAARKGDNPKKEVIAQLNPEWFVDDELRKLKDLGGVKCVLVDPGHPDCPNRDQPRDYLHMTVSSLQDFAQRMLAMPTPALSSVKQYRG